jgi:hypothetical protein
MQTKSALTVKMYVTVGIYTIRKLSSSLNLKKGLAKLNLLSSDACIVLNGEQPIKILVNFAFIFGFTMST